MHDSVREVIVDSVNSYRRYHGLHRQLWILSVIASMAIVNSSDSIADSYRRKKRQLFIILILSLIATPIIGNTLHHGQSPFSHSTYQRIRVYHVYFGNPNPGPNLCTALIYSERVRVKSTFGPSTFNAVRMNLLGPILAIFSLATAIGAKLEKVSIEGPGNTSAQVENRFVSPPGGILPKTIVSSKLRLVFLVGLEGSAHHYLLNAFEHFFPDEGGIKAQQKGCQVMYESLEVQHSMKTSPSFYMKNIEEARGRIRTLAEHASSLSPEEAVATLCGMFSYPRNVGIYKVFQYIDLGALADLAEEEGIDLRVIYLKRPAKDIVISTTVHRHFQT